MTISTKNVGEVELDLEDAGSIHNTCSILDLYSSVAASQYLGPWFNI